MNDKKITINVDVDLAQVQGIVDDALKLDDNALLFKKLAEFAHIKKQVSDAMEAVGKIEADVKGFISAKAKQLYGDNWQAIAGPGYKISRSFTGAKYEQVGAAAEDFIIIKQSVDSKAVENFVKANNKLPEGIAASAARGQQIRITIKEGLQ